MAEVEIIKRPDAGGNQSAKKAGQAIKKTAWTAFFESLASIVLGILLIAWPNEVIKIIAFALGAFLVVKGGYRIVNYYLAKGQKDFFNNDLFWGVVSVLAGITIMVLGENIAGAFRIVVGIWIIYEALVRFNTMLKLHAAGVSAWRYTLIVALLMLILGAFVTFYDGAVAVLVGWMMVIAGVVGMVGDVMFMQYVGALVEKLSK